MDIRPLSHDEELYRQEALALAAHYLGSVTPLSMEQVQELYQVVAEDFRDYDNAQTAVGVAFGEAIMERAGWEWVRVTDEYGAETALSPHGYMVACHPISIIKKRIAANEQIDLAELRDETIKTVDRLVGQGHYAKRET